MVMDKKGMQLNNMAKKGVLALMLASTALLGASCPIKNTSQTKTQEQTELLSKEASEALKLNSMQQTQQYSRLHTTKI